MKKDNRYVSYNSFTIYMAITTIISSVFALVTGFVAPSLLTPFMLIKYLIYVIFLALILVLILGKTCPLHFVGDISEVTEKKEADDALPLAVKAYKDGVPFYRDHICRGIYEAIEDGVQEYRLPDYIVPDRGVVEELLDKGYDVAWQEVYGSGRENIVSAKVLFTSSSSGKVFKYICDHDIADYDIKLSSLDDFYSYLDRIKEG